MKANTKNKKNKSPMRKLIPAFGSLMISAAMLSTSTYAWFTMNKTVTVTGMEMKAHAEEGLLINEVKAADSHFWDDAATANATAPTTVVLRPASTSDMTTFWHANSKKSYDEAGVEALDDTVDVDASHNKYINVTAGQTGISDNKIVGPETDTGEGANPAVGNSKAETHIYYKDASFGSTASGYDDGEGFYAKYTYYLKSSGDADMTVDNLQAKVKATKKTGDNGTSTNLEKSLRVGIVVPISNSSSTVGGYKIFAPVAGADNSYGVTADAAGTAGTVVTVNPEDATTTGEFTNYVRLNNSDGAATPAYTSITIPKTTSAGLPVYVYVWFEGEDTNCMSDNLTDILCTYDIDISFQNESIY
jgi:hypothetical protein